MDSKDVQSTRASRGSGRTDHGQAAWLATALAIVLAFPVAAWMRSAPKEKPAAPAAAASPPPAAAPMQRIGARAATQYLQFEPNRGQAPEPVRYVSRGPGHRIEVLDDSLSLSIVRPPATPSEGALTNREATRASVRFVGARTGGDYEAREPVPGRTSYLAGGDESKWIRDVPRYRQLRRPELYPGIDLVYYSREGALEFDMVVKPGADPSRIRMRVDGARPPVIDAGGDLLLDGTGGSLRLHRPVLYQNIAGEKKILDARYVLRGERSLGFALPDYDKRYPLVIDPVFKLVYSTYVTGFHDDQVDAVTLDAQGNAFVVGQSNSNDFAVSGNAYQTGKSTSGFAFNLIVTKFDPSGTLIYSSYLGGTGSDLGAAIAVDAAGNAYVTGNTTSRDFPVTAGAYQPVMAGSQSAFLAVLSPDGSALRYSTFYGGSGGARAYALALDAGGAPVLAGTAGPGLLTTAAVYKAQLATGAAGFVARFSPLAGGPPQLVAATYYGVDDPQANDTARGNTLLSMALDSNGAPWITGQAYTTNLPLTANALQGAPSAMSMSCVPGPAALNGFAYVARLSPDLGSLGYASYLSGRTVAAGGSACSEFGRALKVDSNGDVYVAGATGSAGFPTTASAVQPLTPAGTNFAAYVSFISKLKGDGSALLWSTYFGGDVGNTFINALALDPAAQAVWATSVTSGGSNYPLTPDALQSVHGGGGADAGIAQLDAASGALKYSTFLGGNAPDVGFAIAIDGGGNAVVAGNTYSPDFPVTADAYEKDFRPDFYGGGDWFFSILGNGAIARVTPASAGNGGDITVQVRGAGLVSGSSCSLESAAGQIAASLVAVVADGSHLNCTFALNGAAIGTYDLVLTRPDGSVLRRAAALDVHASTGGAELAVNVVGRATIRAGTPARFQLTVTNSGDSNAYAAMATISLPAALTADFKFTPLKPAFPGDPTDYTGKFPAERVQNGVATRYIVFPFIPAGGSASLDFDVTSGATGDSNVEATVCTSGPTTIDDWKAYAAGMPGSSRAGAVADVRRFAELAREHPQLTAAQNIRCFGSVLIAGSAVAAAAGGLGLVGSGVVAGAAVGALSGVVVQGFASAAEGGGGVSMTDVTMNGAQAAVGATLHGVASNLFAAIDIQKNCDPSGSIWKKILAIFHALTSLDPNDKSGPTGDGSPAHYLASRPLPYQIAFENLATASLAAANVVITDRLDVAKVDPSTLRLGSIRFGTRTVPVPAGLTSYTTVQAIDATMSIRVQGSVDTSTGILKWTFTTIDPATGLSPSDPTIGFLPPDTDGVKGQGYVGFTVTPRPGLADGTVIANQALVVFDANPAILTPTWINTLDATPPTSRVQSAVGKVGTQDIDVSWSGSDVSSGVSTYTVFVSDNGGDYVPWQSGVSATEATYTGVSGHSYAFNVRSTDGAGNVESLKSAAEATISVQGTFTDPSGGGGGGCTLGPNSQRDGGLPLMVLIAVAVLLIGRRTERRRHRREED